MKILQLCNKPPFPAVDGGCVAMNAITSAYLANGHSVKVLAVSTQKHPFLNDKITPEYLKETAFETVFIDTSLNSGKAFLNLFSRGSYNVERFYSHEFENKLKQVLSNEEFDVIQFESIFVAPYLQTVKQYSTAKTVLRAHNVEHLIWQRMAAQASNPLKKAYLGFLAKRLKQYELDVIPRFDGVASITGEDKTYFKKQGVTTKTEVFPIGIDATHYTPSAFNEVEFPSLFHLGSMDWMPNQEGIKWFIENAWPQIHAEFPDLTLYLAGRNMPGWLETLQVDGIKIIGAVDNAINFMRHKAIMIVPLLSGGGMRVKIVEGMALGKAIISTTVGAEGIDYSDNENILIANTPTRMNEYIRKCTSDVEFYKQVCQNARTYVLANFDHKKVAEKLTYFYQQL